MRRFGPQTRTKMPRSKVRTFAHRHRRVAAGLPPGTGARRPPLRFRSRALRGGGGSPWQRGHGRRAGQCRRRRVPPGSPKKHAPPGTACRPRRAGGAGREAGRRAQLCFPPAPAAPAARDAGREEEQLLAGNGAEDDGEQAPGGRVRRRPAKLLPDAAGPGHRRSPAAAGARRRAGAPPCAPSPLQLPVARHARSLGGHP